jgi:CHASE2 domain-containing sensor protein
MNASHYAIRQNRPNQLFAAAGALLASALVLSSVLFLFASEGPAAPSNAVAVQQHAAERA